MKWRTRIGRRKVQGRRKRRLIKQHDRGEGQRRRKVL
jgi:hypothetical protein